MLDNFSTTSPNDKCKKSLNCSSRHQFSAVPNLVIVKQRYNYLYVSTSVIQLEQQQQQQQQQHGYPQPRQPLDVAGGGHEVH